MKKTPMDPLTARTPALHDSKTRPNAIELVARARAHSGMSEEDAMGLANREVRAARKGER